MQITKQATHTTQQSQTTGMTLSIEVLAYLALTLLALTFRIAELDAVQLSDYEAQQALHAWHTITPSASGEFATSNSPITYTTQLITFATLGGNELTARLSTVIAGMLLSLSPLLFRGRIGKTRAFVWALLLSLLTTPIVSSRYADGTTWMMLFAVLSMWAIWRYWYTKHTRDALWATAFVTCMVLLSSPSGIPLFVILIAAGWLALWRTALSAPERLDLTGDDILAIARKHVISFPYMAVAWVPVFAVVTISTLFMLNPAGLSTVSQLINTAIIGITQPAHPDGVRLGFVALFTYEPLLIVFAISGAWLLWRHDAATFAERFAVAWAVLGTVGLLLYAGATPSDVMWVTIPLTLLASYGITELMVNRLMLVFWDTHNTSNSLYSTQYGWVKWVISLGTLLLLFVVSVHFQEIARSLLLIQPQTSFGDILGRLIEPTFNELRYALLWFILGIIISTISFLLVSSFWGNESTLQGIGLGFVMFLLFSGVGGAWNTAIENPDHPAELWYIGGITDDAYLIRDTLYEISNWEYSGFPLIDVTVVSDANSGIRQDGLIAWILRDFPNAQFVNTVNAAQGDPIIITVTSPEATPELGGDYVGQSFTLRRHWSTTQLNPIDVWAWWSQRKIREEQIQQDIAILWLRQDIYNGIATTQ
jgi:4-amino-4-deoxy-L-arabinose transferase-like glycosyltransferase